MMHLKITIPLLVYLLILAFGCGGCAPGGYGKIRFAAPEMTIGQLTSNWKDYRVSYAGVRVSRPNAILFDPNDDGKTITLHEHWSPVEDEESLGDLLEGIGSFEVADPPSLYVIVDPDDRIYGYLYSVATSTNIKVIDEYTMWIDDMTLRPEDKAEYTIY